MPSSSPSVSLVDQATVSPLRQKVMHNYRQTTYRDGAGFQIAEVRRHSSMVRKVGSPTQAYTDFVLFPTDDIRVSPGSYSGETLYQHPTPKRKMTDPVSGLHVTSAKHLSKARPKPVIIQQARGSGRILSKETGVSLQALSDLKPPRTPRPVRLSTPELSGLDEVPFCDCGVAGHVVKCCIACGKGIGRR